MEVDLSKMKNFWSNIKIAYILLEFTKFFALGSKVLSEYLPFFGCPPY